MPRSEKPRLYKTLDEEDLTITNNHVPTSFKIQFLQYKDGSIEPQDISNIFKDYIKEIIIDKELGDLDRATIKMEYSVTADSYKNESGTYANNQAFPPWVLFQKSFSKDLKFIIQYSFLSSNSYYYKVSPYNFQAISTAKSEALKNLNQKLKTIKSTGVRRQQNASTNTTSVGDVDKYIREYVTAVSDEIKKVEATIKPFYELATNNAILFTGVPVVHSFKGGENGVVEFEITMHTKPGQNDRSQQQNAIRYNVATNQMISNGSFMTEATLLSLANDALFGHQITMEEFALALFGLVRKGDTYEVGLRTVKSQNKYRVFIGGPDITPDNGETSTQQTAAREFLEALKKANIILDFHYLSDKSFNENFIGDQGQSADINKMLTYPTNAYNIIQEGIKEKKLVYKDDLNIKIMIELKRRYAVFLQKINSITTNNTLLDQSYVMKYLNAIKDVFKIYNTNRLYDDNYNNYLALHLKQVEPIKPVDSKRRVVVVGSDVVEERNVILLDYGGAVVNFQHTVRPDPIRSSKNATAKTKTIDIPNDEGLSLQFEVDQEAVDIASKKLYQEQRGTGSILQAGVNYYQALQEDIKRDPDYFLNRFTKLIGTNGGNIQQITDSTGVNAVGGQKLTLNLRHAIPNISYNSTIYFYGAGETTSPKDFESSALSINVKDPGFYIIPPNIRGVYLVTKITNTFNAKENIWTQRLECSR